MVYPKEDRTRYEFHMHLSRMGIEGTVINPGELDLDYDYPYLDLDQPASGATSLGSIRLHGYPIDIVNIVRERIYEVGHVGFGGDYGPHEYISGGWRFRFFNTQYDELEVPLPSDVTDFHLSTKTKIEKKFMGNKVVDFEWEVPSTANRTRIADEILKRLNSDPNLREMVLNELSRERSITLKSYKPKKTVQQIGRAEESHARILLHGELRKRKDIFISTNTFEMYNKIAKHILQIKAAL